MYFFFLKCTRTFFQTNVFNIILIVISGKFGNYIPSKLGTNEEAFLGDYGVSNIIKPVKRTVDKHDEDDTTVMDTNVPWSEETTPDLLF